MAYSGLEAIAGALLLLGFIGLWVLVALVSIIQYQRLLEDVRDVRVQVIVQAETGPAAFLVGWCERMARGVAARGGITTNELDR